MIVEPIKKNFNINLEALRGFAAIFVVFNHLLALSWAFDPKYLPTFTVVFAPSGHLSVLVFFVLSGYVIEASNSQLVTRPLIGNYIKKRFLRIYPIYFVAMVITILITKNNYSVFLIVCNFLLLQDLLVPPFVENGPAWSLHFEVLYYILYIPLSFFRNNLNVFLLLSVSLALANYCFYPNVHTPIISSYLFGFSFWLAGACIAKYLEHKGKNTPYNILLSGIFLLLALDPLLRNSGLPDVIDNVSYKLFNHHLLYPIVDSSKIIISYKDLAFLPYCVYLIVVFSGKKFKGEKLFFILLQIPLLYSVALIGKDYFISGHHAHILSYLIPVIYYFISLTIFFVDFGLILKTGEIIINWGARLGGISYAVYIIHAPLIFLLGRMNFFNNHLLSYITRVVVLMALVLGLGFLLEKIFQPWIKGVFFPNRGAKPSINVK